MLLSAAAALAEPEPSTAAGLVPAGVPVVEGRVALGRYRWLLAGREPGDTFNVVVGFATACWIGRPGAVAPRLGELAYRGVVTPDVRGRVLLDRTMRAYLHVADGNRLSAVIVPLPDGGQPDAVLVIPTEGFAARCEGVRL